MRDLPGVYSSRRISIWHALFLPVFFILFILVFKPADIVDLMSGTSTGYSFNLTITSCIILVVMIITRLLFSIIMKKRSNSSYFNYLIWVIIELTACVCFISLYYRLLTPHGLFFDILGRVAFDIIAILIFPYIILSFSTQLQFLENKNEVSESNRIRFYDDKRILKFISSSNSILYIEADINYVTIVHTDGDKIKEFTLRNSMKNIEELCKKHKLLRCHRSYIVNVAHITSLHKEKDGTICAKLDHTEAKTIPVSQRYYLGISESL